MLSSEQELKRVEKELIAFLVPLAGSKTPRPIIMLALLRGSAIFAEDMYTREQFVELAGVSYDKVKALVSAGGPS